MTHEHMTKTALNTDQIRALRDTLNETVLQFSQRFSVSARTVEGWEQGRRPARKYRADLLRLYRTMLRTAAAQDSLRLVPLDRTGFPGGSP